MTSGTLSTVPGPLLLTDAVARAASVRCDGELGGAVRPVLLVHGTGSTPEESFGPVYLPQLRAAGYPVCTVALPDRATDDMQVSVEHVVEAVRTVAAAHGGPVDYVGHSQGATLGVLALEYWPDLPGLVEHYVGLAPTFTPSATGAVLCAVPCAAPFIQRLESSEYFAEFRSHPLPDPRPPLTTVATEQDEVAAPAPEASRLEGATNLVLQDRCPRKVVEHFGLLVDGTTYAYVLDGLTGDGPVDPARLRAEVCDQVVPPGSDPALVAGQAAVAVAADLAANATARKYSEEPPVRCWVRSDCADVDLRGRLLRSVAATPSGDAVLVRLDVQAPGVVEVDAGGEPTLVPVGPGVVELRVPRNGDVLRVATATGFYEVVAQEAALDLGGPSTAPDPVPEVTAPTSVTAGGRGGTGSSAPNGRTSLLAATGPSPLAAAALPLVAVGLLALRRHRPSRA